MTSSECPEGFHKRASYVTKTGKKVIAACVRSTNSSRSKHVKQFHLLNLCHVEHVRLE